MLEVIIVTISHIDPDSSEGKPVTPGALLYTDWGFKASC